jgi:hypothetical protein
MSTSPQAKQRPGWPKITGLEYPLLTLDTVVREKIRDFEVKNSFRTLLITALARSKS